MENITLAQIKESKTEKKTLQKDGEQNRSGNESASPKKSDESGKCKTSLNSFDHYLLLALESDCLCFMHICDGSSATCEHT